MAEIINLRTARKRITRKVRDRVADVNRAKFGRMKAEKQITSARTTREQQNLDGHRLEDTSKKPVPPKLPSTD